MKSDFGGEIMRCRWESFDGGLPRSLSGALCGLFALCGGTAGSQPAVFDATIYPAPGNDLIENAFLLAGEDGAVAGTTLAATASGNDPKLGGRSIAASVWYRWVAPGDGVYLFAADADTDLGLFTGDPSALAPNPLSETDGNRWRERVTAEAGSVWWILVGDGYAGFTLRYEKENPPANDGPETAILLSGESGRVRGTLADSGPRPTESGLFLPWRTVWYRWVAPVDGTYVFGNDVGPVFAYEGYPSLATRNPNAFDTAGARAERVQATAGSEWWIAVQGEGAGGFTLSYRREDPPSNDGPETATEITGVHGRQEGRFFGSGQVPSERNVLVGSRCVWYRWTAPESGSVSFSTTLGWVMVWRERADGLTPRGRDGYSGTINKGDVLIIAVNSQASEGPAFTFSWQMNIQSTNNLLSTAALLVGDEGTTVGSTQGARVESSIVPAPLPAVWYRWRAPGSGTYQLSRTIVYTEFQSPLIGVYTIDSEGLPVAIANKWSRETRMEWLEFEAKAGQIYYFALFQRSGQPSPIKLTWAQKHDVTLPAVWYFAEGATYPEFETYLMMSNPDSEPVDVEIRLLFADRPAQSFRVNLRANGRETVRLNNRVKNASMAIEARSTDGRGFAAERVVYRTNGFEWEGGHASAGVNAPSAIHYFAEGAGSPSNGAGNHFQTFLLIANPNDVPARLDIVYTSESGASIRESVTVPAKSRHTLEPASQHALLRGQGFSTQLTTSRSTPIVAERAMWWVDSRWDAKGFSGGHASPGITALSTEWHFAQSIAAGNGSEFLLLLNPGSAPANVSLEYLMVDSPKRVFQEQLPPRSRRTIDVGRQLGSAARHSVRIRSSRPIAAEQSMYWSTTDAAPDDGDNTTGTTELSEQWLFAEGAWLPSLQTEFAFSNPGSEPVTVNVRFLPVGKPPVFHALTVGAERSATLRAAEFPELAGEAFATFVKASAPIAAERSTVFGFARSGGTTSAGIPARPLQATGGTIAADSKGRAPGVTGTTLPTPTPTPVPSPTPSGVAGGGGS